VVPDAIIADFARALGVESTTEYMDADDGQRGVKGFERIKKKVKGLMREGFSASQILSQVSDMVFQRLFIHRFFLSFMTISSLTQH
jgi:replication factor C subunit 2/4